VKERPWVLGAVDSPKAWGSELWLTSTRPEGTASVLGARSNFAALVREHPDVLGAWSHRIFGEEMPIFAKFIHTNFPSRVHIGFRKPVEREEMLSWLVAEQASLRELFAALRPSDESGFTTYQALYSAWATRQALAAWRLEDEERTTEELGPFFAVSFDLRGWLKQVRANRAKIVETLNDVDLEAESGNLLLTAAGVIHGIFGLSLQTHPQDHSRAPLERLYERLGGSVAAGAHDDVLTREIAAAKLGDARALNSAPPKNEAWFPAVLDGLRVLLEPQQTSDTTYSLADFYTPLTFTGGEVRFRKGHKASGLTREELAGYLAGMEFGVTPLESIRRAPKAVPGGARPGGELFTLVDEPTTWPFFTAYQLELTGTVTAMPPPGVFQQLVVTRGRADLGDAAGVVGELTSRTPGFIPASVSGPYTLTAKEPTSLFLFSVPGARGGGATLRTGSKGSLEIA
jgi:hypothetical protein